MQLVHIDSTATAAAIARPEPELSLVPAAPAGERARQLLEDAKAAALEHLEALRHSILETRALSENVVRAGDLYAVGLQELARRLADEMEWRAKTLDALIERQRDASNPRPLFRSAQS